MYHQTNIDWFRKLLASELFIKVPNFPFNVRNRVSIVLYIDAFYSVKMDNIF